MTDMATTELDGRLERGRQIAASGRLRAVEDGTWLVLSQSKAKTRYLVNPNKQTCTCPDFETWELPCKHIFAVRIFGDPEMKKTIKSAEPVPKPTYQQDWERYNAAQIGEKEVFSLLLKGLAEGVEQPKQEKGQPRLTLADVVYASTMKVYTTFSGRRASTDLRECESKGHIGHAPHHNSISHYLCPKALTPLLKQLVEQSAAPLKTIELSLPLTPRDSQRVSMIGGSIINTVKIDLLGSKSGSSVTQWLER